MKNVRMAVALAAALALALALVGCGGTAPSASSASTSSAASMSSASQQGKAVVQINTERVKRLAFTDDATCAADLEYCNSLREAADPAFTQAIVIMSDFHSPSGADVEGTAWEPDTDYEDYSWHLARTDGGEWKLLTWSYA